MVHTEQSAAQAHPSDVPASLAHAEEFAAFYRGHRRILFGTATYEGARRDEAEDVVHDVMADLYKRWAAIDDPLAYARKAIRNQVIKRLERERNFLRRHFTGGTQPLDTVEDGVDDSGLIALETRQSVADLLTAVLTPMQREVFALYAMDLSHAQIAEMTGNKECNVRQLIHKSRQRLKAHLDHAAPVPARTSRTEGTR